MWKIVLISIATLLIAGALWASWNNSTEAFDWTFMPQEIQEVISEL